jgi:hypothetical protein
MGWGTTEGLFLAGMLMVSSSAIISKVLQETGGVTTNGRGRRVDTKKRAGKGALKNSGSGGV